jgi:hypothetical protein
VPQVILIELSGSVVQAVRNEHRFWKSVSHLTLFAFDVGATVVTAAAVCGAVSEDTLATGAFVVGAAATGAFVVDAAAIGAFDVGAAATGAFVTGAAVIIIGAAAPAVLYGSSLASRGSQ